MTSSQQCQSTNTT